MTILYNFLLVLTSIVYRFDKEHDEIMRLEKGAKITKFFHNGEFCDPNSTFEFVKPSGGGGGGSGGGGSGGSGSGGGGKKSGQQGGKKSGRGGKKSVAGSGSGGSAVQALHCDHCKDDGPTFTTLEEVLEHEKTCPNKY